MLAKPIRKTILLSIVLFSLTQAKAQIVNNERLANKMAANLSIYIDAFTDPFAESYGLNMNTGWYNTANALDKWHVSLDLVTSGTLYPDEDIKFDFYQLGMTNTELEDPNDSDLPTVIGGAATNTFLYYPTDDNGNRYTDGPFGADVAAEVEMLDGFETPFNVVPNFIPQLRLGLPFGTELKFRGLPKITGEDFDYINIGFGVQHNIGQWFIDEDLELDWSFFGGFTSTEFNFVPELSSDIEAEDENIQFISNTIILETFVSKQFGKLSVFGGAGYYSAENSTEMQGTYRFTYAQQGLPQLVLDDITFEVTDPVDIDKTESGFRGTLGLGFTPINWFTFSASYTQSLRSSLNANISFNF